MSPSSKLSRNQRQSKSSGQVRIISGQWRGRKLAVPAVEGLRPTGDRVRETLFNWLQPYIAGKHCLDLFAGTGAIGFEALSRYASSVTFVEPNSVACQQIEFSLQVLDCTVGSCHRTTAQQFLADNESGSTQAFDLVFVDPPFELEVQMPILQELSRGHLAAGAMVYMESPSRQMFTENWPANFELFREKQFGDVCARLFKVV